MLVSKDIRTSHWPSYTHTHYTSTGTSTNITCSFSGTKENTKEIQTTTKTQQHNNPLTTKQTTLKSDVRSGDRKHKGQWVIQHLHTVQTLHERRAIERMVPIHSLGLILSGNLACMLACLSLVGAWWWARPGESVISRSESNSIISESATETHTKH